MARKNERGRLKRGRPTNGGAKHLTDDAIPRERVAAIIGAHVNMSRTILMMAGALLVSLAVNVVIIAKDDVMERYFATDPDGRITKLTPLHQPYLTHRIIKQFAEEALTTLLTFDGINYRRQFAAARPYFTENAIQQIQNELERNGMLTEVREEAAIVTTLAEGTPIIKAEGVDPQKGVYAWQVQVNLRITIQTRRKKADGRYLAVVRIERRKQTETGQGVLVTRAEIAPR